ncbi:hypothetical protein [Streptomyces doebereineriae]|uniref:Uncharacterized protein n=1 Tax=Streptomyces doebereineriae TaxID=3075528 RepID=A0ABU2VQP6_9ACTN|nr:hypothetical protein [Streptomyces sp. DSM 41640]MDT0487931.1 hypothetical protein [Streptomyces sp. DSM 41640]
MAHVEEGGLGMPGPLLQIGPVNDHRAVATEVRNRITTNRRCITQLLDRARSCQPLLTNPWKKQCDPVGGCSLCLGCELSETVGVIPVQVLFQEEGSDGDEAARGHLVGSRSNTLEQEKPTECLTGYQ